MSSRKRHMKPVRSEVYDMATQSASLIRKSVQLLRAVAEHPEGIGLTDAARVTGIPKPTCHRILATLEVERLIALDPRDKRYRTSLGLLSLMGSLLDASSHYRQAHVLIGQLAESTGETAGLDVMVDDHVVVIAQAQGPHLISQSIKSVPRSLPAHRTSTGKMFLAFRDADEVRREFAERYQREQPGMPPDFDAFLDQLSRFRSLGYAWAYDELEVGAAAIAAPVTVNGSMVYAVWIGGPTYRLTHERIGELARSVVEVATAFSVLLSQSDGGTLGPMQLLPADRHAS